MTERPWVARHLRKPESMASTPRKRPLVYIYDLPAEFNTRMHQYRLDKARHLPLCCLPAGMLRASCACTLRCCCSAVLFRLRRQALGLFYAENLHLETVQPVQQRLIHQYLDVCYRNGLPRSPAAGMPPVSSVVLSACTAMRQL